MTGFNLTTMSAECKGVLLSNAWRHQVQQPGADFVAVPPPAAEDAPAATVPFWRQWDHTGFDLHSMVRMSPAGWLVIKWADLNAEYWMQTKIPEPGMPCPVQSLQVLGGQAVSEADAEGEVDQELADMVAAALAAQEVQPIQAQDTQVTPYQAVSEVEENVVADEEFAKWIVDFWAKTEVQPTPAQAALPQVDQGEVSQEGLLEQWVAGQEYADLMQSGVYDSLPADLQMQQDALLVTPPLDQEAKVQEALVGGDELAGNAAEVLESAYERPLAISDGWAYETALSLNWNPVNSQSASNKRDREEFDEDENGAGPSTKRGRFDRA